MSDFPQKYPRTAPAQVPDARELVVMLLEQWMAGRAYADQLLHEALARETLPDSRDRALATDLFYGVLRYLRLLDFLLAPLIRRELEPRVRNALRLGLYQLLFTRVPPHAAVDSAVNCAGHGRKLVNAVLRGMLRDWPEVERARDQASPEVRQSHPDFLIKRWRNQLTAEELQAFLEWNNRPAEAWVRLNTLKAKNFADLPETEVERLEEDSVFTHPLFRVARAGLPWKALAEGLVYIQDPSTSVSCELLAPQPGETVLDACAAPGGKSTYMAALMQGKGRLVCTESDGSRLDLLGENLRRLGAGFAEVRQVAWGTETEAPADLGEFDAVLADVPCTNTGVLRRRVDARWRLEPREFAQMAETQLGILKELAVHVRPGGGRLVYSTCSVDPQENVDLVAAFLGSPAGEDFRLAEEKSTLPWRDGIDGAYAALLVRR